MREQTLAAFDNILDTFGGADGGVSFINLKWMIENMDSLSDQGEEHATEIIKVMLRFSKLIDVANGKK